MVGNGYRKIDLGIAAICGGWIEKLRISKNYVAGLHPVGANMGGSIAGIGAVNSENQTGSAFIGRRPCCWILNNSGI